MEPFRFLKKHSVISVFFILSILTIISVNYFLIDIPQCWDYGYITGQIFTNFSIGYIVTLIFYFLVVYLKEKKDYKNLSPRISKAIVLILAKGDSLESMLYKGQNNTFRSPKKIEKICKKTWLYDINYSSNTKSKVHWVDFLTAIDNDCKCFMEKIFKLNGVNTRLIKILTDLDDSIMLGPKLVVGLPENDKRTMEPLLNGIIQFFSILDELENYWKENYSDFKEHEKLRRLKK